MLSIDVDNFQLDSYRALLADLLTAVSLWIANFWKLQDAQGLKDWTAKFNNIWLLSKMSAICKYRSGNVSALRNFTSQWAKLLESGYINEVLYNRETLLTVV